MTTIQFDKDTADSVTALAQKILKNQLYGPIGSTNLCAEILDTTMDLGVFYAPYNPLSTIKMTQKQKYKFSREWLVADFDWVHQAEVLEWCVEYFGPHPKNPDAWSRWYNKYSEKIHFRDQADYILFVLRWS